MKASRNFSKAAFFSRLVLLSLLSSSPSSSQEQSKQPAPSPQAKPSPSKKTPQTSQLAEEEELQQAFTAAGNDRGELVRALEEFLKKYPEASQRPQIYRALVEAELQLQDISRAAGYAERIVALTPDDIPITLLAIQLLERAGDQAALRRAVNYSTRVLDAVNRTSADQRSPRVSAEQWELEKKSDLANTYFLRGDLYLKLKDYAAAKKDLQTSYQTLPTAGAAQRLGEAAELQNDLNSAVQEYSRAFALAEGKNGNVSRAEIRKKLGNVWRLARGSNDGLGEYLLRTYDEVLQASIPAKPQKNADAHETADFMLRKAPEGAPFPLKDTRGKVLVVNFWATWCGPCRAMEPHFERVAAEFQGSRDVLFLSANCDEDETLVPAYLEKEKLRTTVVFADGLDRLLAVGSFPTIVILDRSGKIAYRAEGFDPDSVEKDLEDAVNHAVAPAKDSSSAKHSNP